VPARISIPSADASGPVDRMGVKDGALQIPPPGRAGWFDAGPRPGELGRSVIVSHVDTKEGPALFFNLLKLQRGSPVTVRDRRGALHRFAVVRRREVNKKHFSPSTVYGDASHPTLVLITCGGPFSEDTGYRDNVILWARAV
jgi:LPXTG-site transpeptidase (sortase) family protein